MEFLLLKVKGFIKICCNKSFYVLVKLFYFYIFFITIPHIDIKISILINLTHLILILVGFFASKDFYFFNFSRVSSVNKLFKFHSDMFFNCVIIRFYWEDGSFQMVCGCLLI